MTRELTAKELAAIYEGTLVNVDREDTYGVAFEVCKAKISYDEHFHEIAFSGDGYEIIFKDDDDFGGDTIECITYDDETQEAYVEFNEYVPPVTISRSDAYLKYLEKELKAEE